jgi:hypothetical protein
MPCGKSYVIHQIIHRGCYANWNRVRNKYAADQMRFGCKSGSKTMDDPIGPETRGEVIVAPTYAFDLRGRIKVEPKEKIKERLRRSPDRGMPSHSPSAHLFPGGELGHLVGSEGGSSWRPWTSPLPAVVNSGDVV